MFSPHVNWMGDDNLEQTGEIPESNTETESRCTVQGPARKAVSGARARGHCPGNSWSVRKLGAQRAPWATWFAHWPRGGRSLSSLGCAFGCHEMSNVEI